MLQSVTPSQFIDQLIHHSDDICILTPNRRLAATLHQLYRERMTQRTETKCWPTPDILPYLAWVQRLWSSLLFELEYNGQTQVTLSPTHESFMWEKIIQQSQYGEILLRTTETADLAYAAWKILSEWNIEPHTLHQHEKNHSSVMHEWITEFTDHCNKQNFISSDKMIRMLLSQLTTNMLAKTIILVGFTELSPLQNKLLDKCKSLLVNVEQIHIRQSTDSVARISFVNQDDEITAIARWAKSAHLKNPNANIGCIFPNLNIIRDRVEDIFTRVFQDHEVSQPFNISAGKPLGQYPISKIALMLLGLHKKSLSLQNFSHLLLSPFIGEAEKEYLQRAKYDAILRRANINTVYLTDILADESSFAYPLAQYCPKLYKRLSLFYQALSTLPDKLNFADWFVQFHRLLTLIGWPGERSLSSKEYQLVEHWLYLSTTLTSLDQICAPVNYVCALHQLQRIAAETIFQPQTPAARIQILGVLEAAGTPFDYLWLAQLSDTVWPPKANPNPFISKKLQRELSMPHATALRELNYCRAITQQFLQSAHHIIISHSSQNDELASQPSPLIKHFPEIDISDLDLPSYTELYESIYQTKELEISSDTLAPAVISDNNIFGGVNIIKLQALCPFKCVAESRLHAKELEAITPGLRSSDRGTLIHKTLELLWNHLGNQEQLLALSHQDQTTLINSCIDAACQTLKLTNQRRNKYLILEKSRTLAMINDWLAIEKARPPFKVLHNESKETVCINDLSLTIRIDRIDQLENGKKIIIDYKTGINNDISNWFEQRPDEPQLPIYSLLDTHQTVAISYAQLSPGVYSFKGISAFDLDIPGIKPIDTLKNLPIDSWPGLLAHWQNIFSQLSSDFLHGKAEVAPKDNQTTCTWCGLKPFCRIHEDILQNSQDANPQESTAETA